MRLVSPTSPSGMWIAIILHLSVASVVHANENWFAAPLRNFARLDPSKRGADYEFVVPRRVDERGMPLTDNDDNDDYSKCYIFNAFRLPYHFCVQPNVDLLPPEFVVLGAEQDGHSRVNFKPRKCYYRGALVGDEKSTEVAISVCNGSVLMSGLIRTSTAEIVIEPLPEQHYRKFDLHTSGGAEYHIVYRRLYRRRESDDGSGSGDVLAVESSSSSPLCDVTDTMAEVEGKRRRRRRNAPVTRPPSIDGSGYRAHMELMVVADPRMMEGMESTKAAEEYILTQMNIVDSLFTDSDLGLGIKISVVQLKMLADKDGLDLGEKATPGDALRQFQQWQRKFNTANGHADHFDVAVLLTGTNLCNDQECYTIGRADIGSMCSESRSAVIAQDMGLMTAFIVAHELGHALSVMHDGNNNNCSGLSGYVMSPQVGGSMNMFRWSKCSRVYVDNFLRSQKSDCLFNWPDKESLTRQRVRQPGEIYSIDQQCRLRDPSNTGACHESYTRGICPDLGCRKVVNGREKCDHGTSPAADGTPCDPEQRKICWKGECIERPTPVNGRWSMFNNVGECSRRCGGGVIKQRRFCSEPPPRYGGLSCLGNSVRYALCNTEPCSNGLSARDDQCAKRDNVIQLGASFVSHIQEGRECDLICKNIETRENFELLQPVDDGTPCTTNDTYRCMSGTCRKIGCDLVVDSGKVIDDCGVCGGDGSSCRSVTRTLAESLTKDGYTTLYKFKTSVRDVRLREKEPSLATYFIFKSADHVVLLNGSRGISQTVTYAGLRIRYNRSADGHEQVFTEGKLNNTMSFGVVYDSSRGPSSPIELSFVRAKLSSLIGEVMWKAGEWSACSASCGQGNRRRSVQCYSRPLKRSVSLKYCKTLLSTSMPPKFRSCGDAVVCIEYRWIADPWTACNSTCGKSRPVGCYELTTSTGQIKGVPDEKCSDRTKLAQTTACSVDECKTGRCKNRKNSCDFLAQMDGIATMCKINESIKASCCAMCNDVLNPQATLPPIPISSGTDSSD